MWSLSCPAQTFPWEIFKPRTLKEVIATTTSAVRPDDTAFLATNELESKVEVTFTGRSRPIISDREAFIKIWVGTFSKPAEYASLYQNEYLYKEGDAEYWIATEEPITKYFDKELHPGDRITIYLISIGAYRQKTSIDCVLLVEEYQIIAAKAAPAVTSIPRIPIALHAG